MPQSDHWAIPWVVDVAHDINPTSVLDVGVGMGQFGFHLRQSLEIGQGRLTPKDWRTQIHGIELFEAYRNPLWMYCYDSVTIGDCRQILGTLERSFDLVLMCDVIEHFDREEALLLLSTVRRRCDWLIITTPNGKYPQGAVYDNEGEVHRSEWTPTDFHRLGGATHEVGLTFLGLLPGDTMNQSAQERLEGLPILFRNTASSLAKCAASWLPKMVRNRTRRLFGNGSVDSRPAKVE